MNQNLDQAINATLGRESAYVFHCEVKSIKVQVATPLAESRGDSSAYETEVAILVPDKSQTSFNEFMMAYYDEDELPYLEEFIAALPYPISTYCRLSFDHESDQYKDFHFMVMSEKPDEVLRQHMMNKRIEIKIMPDSFEMLSNSDE